jgi:NAD(P)-dependent dehydrogenase (short-subunit alcohol dehydrogenase family)
MTKCILIIGAERGLGLGLAEQFFERGWDVTGAARPGTDTADLKAVGANDPARLSLAEIDVTVAQQIEPLIEQLGAKRFDVIFFNAGIWGAEHQSVVEATDEEFAQVMLTNTFGPIRLAHRLLDRLKRPGTLCFMTSHRASIDINLEGGIELYRASKVAQNMLARGIWATHRDDALTVLSIHPGWVKTEMGTLGGTVKAEIELEPSVRGVADVVEQNMGSGDNRYLDWEGKKLNW